MPGLRGIVTPIPGGDGSHSVQFLYWTPEDGRPEDEPYALLERHRHTARPNEFHSGYVAWRKPEGAHSAWIVVQHQIVAGGPDEIAGLTLNPSLSCAYLRDQENPCQSHGFIRDGGWVDA